MKRPREPALPLPRYDYGLALQTAVSWLGDRYLLAQPVPRRNTENAPYFVEPPHWYDTLARKGSTFK